MQGHIIAARLLLTGLMLAQFVTSEAQEDDPETASPAAIYKGLELRNIGPALMSGRIADIDILPEDPSTWYVSVGSGGVWKTENAGTTWKPLFDGQPVYSIGSLTIDPHNPHRIWVGTGEDVGGRHVSFGDGVYLSEDGGENWAQRGLPESEHITRIIVHPEDPDILWVAAQGPLWSPAGQRGIFKSGDAGKTWRRTLGDDAWTGAASLEIDPRHPDRLYAATWQHHRTVAAYMGGGPKSRIYRSDDGGDSWTRLEKGLPEGNMGKIGLALSPQNPDIVYAAVELDRREGAIYRSMDRGASWEKRSDTVSGGTGPHYYQEIFASPHHQDTVYLMSNRTMVSRDGGASFQPLNSEHRHGDDHALAFRADDPDYLLIGTDGGVYESHDMGISWRYIENLPVTQFYKVAVDDDAPFYNIYGGTQDNSTQGGPSRTDNVHGIRSSDWFLTLFGDGHQPATEPGNPDIVYSQWQQGNLVRYDRRTGEIVYVKPQAGPDAPPERFNWDAPILVSPHDPTRLYHASQRVWRSDDRGDSWRPVSPDLTRDQQRERLEIMGRRQGWDAPWDLYAMSQYNTVTSLAESPLVEGLLYAGTDDGLLQVSSDAGENWRRIEVGSLPGVPDTAFVNDIKADLFDADTVYVALDNHKYGDYRPYLLKSTDRGRRWRSIAGDLPDRHLVWRLVQDHERPELLFAGTEFGLFFSVDGGQGWIELQGNVPTISFRDLAIQRRESDLVGATFGRGFFVLDDYSPLRQVNDQLLAQPAALFTPRKAWWYVPRRTLGGSEKATQGASFYTAPNPPFGAVLTYYLKEDLETAKSRRQKAEKPLASSDEDYPFPTWDEVEAERLEPDPAVLLTVRDSDGNVVRRLTGPAKKGFHRVAWDLRFPAPHAIGTEDGWPADTEGRLAAPGTYSVTLATRVAGEVTELDEPRSFEVVPMRRGTLEGAGTEAVVDFWEQTEALQRRTTAAVQAVVQTRQRIEQLGHALSQSRAGPELDSALEALRQDLESISTALTGAPTRQALGSLEPPSVLSRLQVAMLGTRYSTYGPTPTHRQSLEIAQQQFDGLRSRLNSMLETRLPAFERSLAEAGAPWVPGQSIP